MAVSEQLRRHCFFWWLVKKILYILRYIFVPLRQLASPGPLRGGSRGYLWYRARIFLGAQNLKNATHKTIDIGYKFERATLDCLKADRVTPHHHLPVQCYPSLTPRVLLPPPPVSITAEVASVPSNLDLLRKCRKRCEDAWSRCKNAVANHKQQCRLL